MPQDTPSRHLDQYVVRFPDGMRDELKRRAKENGRSLNAEIIARLAASLDDVGQRHPSLDEAVAEHGGDLQALLASETIRLRELLERIEVRGAPRGTDA